MSETKMVVDRHYIVPLTDEEHKDVKLKALEADLKIKNWVRQAITEKLLKEEN